MRYLFGALAFIFSFYALVLVTLNNESTVVELLYVESGRMTFGLALVISISVGMLVGFFLAVFYFKVYQNSKELKSLRKLNGGLKAKIEEANKKIEAQSKTLNVVGDTLNSVSGTLQPNKPKPVAPAKIKQIKIFKYTLTWV